MSKLNLKLKKEIKNIMNKIKKIINEIMGIK